MSELFADRNQNLQVPEKLQESWQAVVDLLHEVADTPSAIITRIYPPYIEVFKASDNEGRIYEEGQVEDLANRFCENVYTSRQSLDLPNVMQRPEFRNAPEVAGGVVSYLGFPISWPDGEIFGTLCVLDRKPREHSEKVHQLLRRFSVIIEQHLASIWDAMLLKEANEAKDQLFSIISHDLRGPMSTLYSMTEYLADAADDISPQEIRTIAASLGQAAGNGMSLLENLLNWSRLRLDRMEISPRDYSLRSQVDKVLEQFEQAASQKGLVLKNLVEEGVVVRADRESLDSVIRNLVSNAVKFTESGGKIELRSRTGNGLVEMEVADSGVGLGPEELDRLFNLETRFSEFGTAGEKGAGLGLIVSKELVEKNRGGLSVQSAPGSGTTFTISLPAGAG
jgi:signal transduction histidine kinase